MPVGERGHTHRERPQARDQLDELDRPVEAARGALPRRAGTAGGVAAQRQHAADSGVGVGTDDLAQLRRGPPDARQVRHRRQRALPRDALRRADGPVLRAATGPVGDGHEVRPHRLHAPDRPPQHPLPVLVAGREELEGHRGAALGAGRGDRLGHGALPLRHDGGLGHVPRVGGGAPGGRCARDPAANLRCCHEQRCPRPALPPRRWRWAALAARAVLDRRGPSQPGPEGPRRRPLPTGHHGGGRQPARGPAGGVRRGPAGRWEAAASGLRLLGVAGRRRPGLRRDPRGRHQPGAVPGRRPRSTTT